MGYKNSNLDVVKEEIVMKQSILLYLFWSPTTGRTIRNDGISAHIGMDVEQPTPEEMSSMLYVAKREFARMRQKKKRA